MAVKKQPYKKQAGAKTFQSKTAARKKSNSVLPWVIFGAGILFLIIVRLRLLAIPFERDEAGFTYIGKMMFEGKNLYTDLPDNKLPGLYFFYGLFTKIFGYNPEGVHLGLLLFNLASCWFLFLFVRSIFDLFTAAVTILVFSILITGIDVFGFAAHATQLSLLPATCGLWLLQKAVDKQQWYFYLISGICFGIAFTIKQQAICFAAAAGLYLLFEERESQLKWLNIARDAAIYIAGCIIPFAAITGYMQMTGRSEAFWYWTFQASVTAESAVKANVAINFFNSLWHTMHQQWLFYLLAIAGCVICVISSMRLSRKIFLCAFILLSLASVIPGFNFYPHYYVLLMPAVAVAVSCAVNYFRAGGGWRFFLSLIVLIIAIIQAVSNQFSYYFKDDHNEILISVYGNNPFPESKALGEFVTKNAHPGDKLLVLGSEPELLVYSNLESAMKHIYTYSMMSSNTKSNQFQDDLLAALRSGPRYVAFTNIQASWFYKDTPQNKEFWGNMTRELTNSKKYKRIAAADLFADGTAYHFDKEASDIKYKRSDQILDIYERIQ
jgi:dolichyl-phosphate-mannose-protein mannosyltransferase